MISERYQNDLMKDIALRGMPVDLHAWLKADAEREGRSLNAHLIQLLQEAADSNRYIREREARLAAFRAKYLPNGGFEMGDEVTEWIRHDRDHGH
ncbi:MAG: hypothetical protein ACI9W4_001490 [Rhodothermales bacterium]|jgi:hypothetical protein